MKKCFHRFIVLVLFLFLSNGFYAQTSPYIFENIGIQEGLSQSVVNWIIQDKKGFLWIATQDGLNRFDGYSLKVFRPNFEDPENSLTDGLINFLINDLNGNLAIGTFSGGLNIYDQQKDKFHPVANKNFTARSIRGIFIDSKNNYWVFHEKGLSKLSFPVKDNYDSVLVKDIGIFLGKKLENLFKSRIVNLIADKDNNMVVQLDNNLYFFGKENTDFEKYDVGNLPPNSFPVISEGQEIFKIATDLNKNIWIIYQNRAEKIIDFKKNIRTTYRFNSNLDLNKLFGLYIASDSCIYARDFERGVTSFGLKTSKLLRIRNEPGNDKSIASEIVNNFCEDKSGILWFATNNGISKYNPCKNKFRHIDVRPGNSAWLQDNWPFCFSEDRFGDIWVGTYLGNGLYIYNKKSDSFRHLEMMDSKNQIRGSKNIMSIHRDRDGQIWVGTADFGLARYNEKNKRFDFFVNDPKDSTTISSNLVYNISEDKEGNLWIATIQGVNKLEKKTGKFKRYLINELNTVTGESNNRVQSVIANEDGSVWLGTFGFGLLKLYFDKQGNPHFKKYISNVKDSTSLSFNSIFSLFKDRENNLWISTFGGGINKFDSKTEKFKRYSVRNGLPNNVVYGALQDESGRIWMSTNRGLCVLDEKNQKIINYTVNHGLQSNEFNQNAFFKDSEGYFYFGGINGYNVFKPSLIQVDTTMSSVIFTDFKLSDKTVVPGINSPLKSVVSFADEINLRYRQNDFSFEFTSDNFSSPSDIQFSYMLDNYHADWINIGHQRSIFFTGLRPGEYILKVRATNPDGIWSNKFASIRIIIHPPFWETTWFKFLIILLVLAGILIYIRIRTKHLLREKQILEQRVKERTAEIESQKNEILDKNEELKQLNEEISSQRDNLKTLNISLTEKNKEIEAQKNEILDKNEELNQLNNEISAQRDNLREMNEELAGMNDEILKQKEVIELKNYNITSSIEYAQRIQNAVLPSGKVLENVFSESFILFKPRDIVSGDFYFIKQFEENICIAAADSTGHGVPGALMSILGITLLNDILGKAGINSAGHVLDELRLQVKTSLRQTGESGEQQDGLDIAFCSINTETLLMEYAGANLPLWIVRKNRPESGNINTSETYSITVCTTDRQPIGIYPKEFPFTNHQVKLEKEDRLYFFTDGYYSQFGGKTRNKMMVKRFQHFILSNVNKPMEDQKQVLQKEFDNWRGKNEQVDDVLVIGIKI
ncbi:MAG: two-component regulator propeller domain-containing protein [Bacteroidales bacterium]